MYYLSECLIIKNESQYLLEHLSKNAQAGIEHFYIYDNYSDISVKEFLKKNGPQWLDKCTIELFKGKKEAQIECYNKFIRQHKKDTKWCAFFDTDELLEGDLISLCKQNEEYCALRILQIIHGANGVAYYNPGKTMTEQFQSHIITKKMMVKIVSQIQYVTIQEQHNAFFDLDQVPELNKHFKCIEINEQCQLHHYFFKSFEEWLQKVKRGNVLSLGGHRVNYFFVENNIDNKDKEILLKKYGLTLKDYMKYNAR